MEGERKKEGKGSGEGKGNVVVEEICRLTQRGFRNRFQLFSQGETSVVLPVVLRVFGLSLAS
jgi:hypothetical protein